MTKKAFNLLFSKRHKSKIVSSKLTVDEISEMWLASVKTNRKESTYSKYKYVYEHHITVEDNCWIGSNCIILDGVTIGKGSVIGAGTLVTKNIAPGSVVVDERKKMLRER